MISDALYKLSQLTEEYLVELKAETLKCPNCDAPITTFKCGKYVCPYCRSTMKIYDPEAEERKAKKQQQQQQQKHDTSEIQEKVFANVQAPWGKTKLVIRDNYMSLYISPSNQSILKKDQFRIVDIADDYMRFVTGSSKTEDKVVELQFLDKNGQDIMQAFEQIMGKQFR